MDRGGGRAEGRCRTGSGEQRATAEMEGGEGLKEADKATGVTEMTGESWEADIARLHSATMAGGSKDDSGSTRQRRIPAGTAGIGNWCVSAQSTFFTYFSLFTFADCFAGQGDRAVGARRQKNGVI